MSYASFVTSVTTILSLQPTDTAFQAVLPDCINYTEDRIQTDLDLLGTIVTDNSGALTANSRAFTLPVSGTRGIFVVVKEIALFLNGDRQPPLEWTTRGFLDSAWPSETPPATPSVPVQWCPVDQASILVGPSPDQAYGVSVVGTQRIQQLSASNTSNFLSINFADLYVAAACVWLSGYQRDFGIQSADPAKAMSWEALYQTRLKSYSVEEAQKKFAGLMPPAQG
jgi:hypothetical protein